MSNTRSARVYDTKGVGKQFKRNTATTLQYGLVSNGQRTTCHKIDIATILNCAVGTLADRSVRRGGKRQTIVGINIKAASSKALACPHDNPWSCCIPIVDVDVERIAVGDGSIAGSVRSVTPESVTAIPGHIDLSNRWLESAADK